MSCPPPALYIPRGNASQRLIGQRSENPVHEARIFRCSVPAKRPALPVHAVIGVELGSLPERDYLGVQAVLCRIVQDRPGVVLYRCLLYTSDAADE